MVVELQSQCSGIMNIVKLLGMGFNKTTADTFSQEKKKEGKNPHIPHSVDFFSRKLLAICLRHLPINKALKAKVAQQLPFPKFINVVEELETNLMSLVIFITLNICSTCFEH